MSTTYLAPLFLKRLAHLAASKSSALNPLAKSVRWTGHPSEQLRQAKGRNRNHKQASTTQHVPAYLKLGPYVLLWNAWMHPLPAPVSSPFLTTAHRKLWGHSTTTREARKKAIKKGRGTHQYHSAATPPHE